MAGDPLIREADDKPVLNMFGLPVICSDVPDENDGECCEPCSDWMYCLLQTFYSVSIPGGIDFANWLADHWLAGNTQYKAGQAALEFTDGGSGTTTIFDGEFLAEPPNQDIFAQFCDFPPRADECTHTHRMRHERTIVTDSLYDDSDPDAIIDYRVKRFGMNVNTECVTVGEDKFLRFTLNLVWEGATGVVVFEPEIEQLDPPNDLCELPKAATPYDPSTQEKAWFCCPLAISDLIDVTTISSLADLSAVVLNKLPARTSTYSTGDGYYVKDAGPDQDCLQTANTWVCCIGMLFTRCFNGAPVCSYYEINPCDYMVDGVAIDPFWPDIETDELQGETIGCSKWEYAGGCGQIGGLTCAPSYCISRPVEFSIGDIVLKVFDNKCRAAEDCKSCFLDPESPVATPIKPGDVRFETDTPSANCNKTLCVVKPTCLTIDKVYWSDGAVTVGDDCHTANITNVDATDIGRNTQVISALILMTNGCAYCWAETLSCGCCEGVGGGLTMSVDLETACMYTFCASVTATEECPQAFLELQILTPGAGTPFCQASNFDDFDACTCEKLEPGGDPDPPCEGWNSCLLSLADGQCITREVIGVGRVRYRIWDAPCGCASDWIEFPIYCAVCDCCIGTIVNVRVTIAGWADAGFCPGCDTVNRTYDLDPAGSGYTTCQWTYGFFDDPGGLDDFACGGDVNPGIQIVWTISCGYNLSGEDDPDLLDLSATVSVTAGASAGFIKYALDVGEPDATAADCSLLTGVYDEIIGSGISDYCTPFFAVCSVEVVTA